MTVGSHSKYRANATKYIMTTNRTATSNIVSS